MLGGEVAERQEAEGSRVVLLEKPLQVVEPAQVVPPARFHSFGGAEPTHIQRQVCIFLQAALHGSDDEGACQSIVLSINFSRFVDHYS